MRKMLILALAVFLAGAAGVVYAMSSWKAQAEDVSYEVTTIRGERRLLDGLQIDMYDTAVDGLLWHNLVDFTADRNTSVTTLKKTDNDELFRMFDLDGLRDSRENAGSDPVDADRNPMFAAIDETGFQDLQEKLLDKSKETDSRKILLSDYRSYMPLRFGLGDLTADPASAKALSEALQLPIPKDYAVWLHEDRVEVDDGALSVASVCTGDSVYFSIEYRRDAYGWDIDMNNMPNGYGVYRVPYSVSDTVVFDTSRLELFFEINPDASVQNLYLSRDQQTVLVLTQKKSGESVISAVSASTGETVSEIPIGDGESRIYFRFTEKPVQGEDCCIIYVSPVQSSVEDSFIVIAKNDEGVWDKVMEIPWNREKEAYPWGTEDMLEGRFAYDGERLVCVVAPGTYAAYYSPLDSSRKDFTDCKRINLYVMTRKGEEYAGYLNGSLQKSWLPSDGYVHNYSLTVQWK